VISSRVSVKYSYLWD